MVSLFNLHSGGHCTRYPVRNEVRVKHYSEIGNSNNIEIGVILL